MTTPVDYAIASIGYEEEPPGSNHTKYGDRFFGPGSRSPWCCEKVSCDTVDAQAIGPYSASVGFYRNQAAQQGRLTDLAGALAAMAAGKCVSVGWEWEHDSWPDHISWLLGQNGDGSLHTIDGNAPGPDGTDEVAYHNRTTTNVAFYCIVDPSGAPQVIPPPAPSGPPHDSHPSGPLLPSWMLLTWHPNKRPGYTNHGDKVALFQSRMATAFGGWWPHFTNDPAHVDGIIGPTTNDIINRFQRQKGLTADGVVGPRTWASAFN